MNSSGYVRGMMSKSTEVEAYLKHVVTTIGRQLNMWDERYVVRLLNDLLDKINYEVIVNLEDITYQVNLQLPNVAALQDKSPYSLDRHIWESLKNQGLMIEKTNGNYLEYCFM